MANPRDSHFVVRLRSIIAAVVSVGFFQVPYAAAQTSERDDSETLMSDVAPSARTADPDLDTVRQSIIERTNRFRTRHDREQVQVDSKLNDAAKYFAEYMARNNKYGHHADGQRPADRAKEHDYDYCIVLENIAYQYNSAGFRTRELAKRFMRGWRNSPGHRKNMLDRGVTDIGVAVARSEQTGYIYAVQMFGRPKDASFQFQIANRAGELIQYQIGKRKFELPPRYTRTHQQCRSAELTIKWSSESNQDSKTLEPTNGDRFVVTQTVDGVFELEQTSADTTEDRADAGAGSATSR